MDNDELMNNDETTEMPEVSCCWEMPETFDRGEVIALDESEDHTANQKIRVKCTKCGEEFIRERRFIDRLHDCQNVLCDKDLLDRHRTNVRVECKVIHPDAVIPYRKRPTDAGYDMTAIESVIIPPGEMRNIRTGIVVTCPQGYYLTVEPRSSLWIKGVTPFHGIVDATYTGELMTALINHGKEPFEVRKGDRIAQFILHKCVMFDMIEVDEISPSYNERGVAGFGASGR